MSVSVKRKKVQLHSMGMDGFFEEYVRNMLADFLIHYDSDIQRIVNPRGDGVIPISWEPNDRSIGFYEVSSDGPQLGFLTFQWDLESGYLVFGSEKRNPFIPWLDMNKLLNSFGYQCSYRHLLAAFEQYKLGIVSLFQFIEMLGQEDKQEASFEGSAVRAYLKGVSSISAPSKPMVSPERFIQILGRIYNTFCIRLRENVVFMTDDNIKHLQEDLRPFQRGYANEFLSYQGAYTYSTNMSTGKIDMKDEVNKRVKQTMFWENIYSWGREEEDMMLWQSTGMRKMAYRSDPMKKAASIVLNLFDMADTQNSEALLYDSLRYAGSNAPGLLERAIESVGLDKILKGAKMTWFKRGVTENADELVSVMSNYSMNMMDEPSFWKFRAVEPLAKLFTKAAQRLRTVA